jgi:hypothetical protein
VRRFATACAFQASLDVCDGKWPETNLLHGQGNVIPQPAEVPA